MNNDNTELTRRDYIPIYGAYKYVSRNVAPIVDGVEILIDTLTAQ